VVRFDEVLALDAHNAAALDGKQLAQEMIRTSRSRQALADAFREGKALFDAGDYEKALPLLTDAAADPPTARRAASCSGRRRSARASARSRTCASVSRR
jgi:hypothetical protein